MTNLLQQANNLKITAVEIINYLKSNINFEDIGELVTVGSVALDLMTWKDIDLDLITDSKINKKDAINLVNRLFNLENINDIRLINNCKNNIELNRPESMYIGAKFEYKNETWKIDIRYLERKDSRAMEQIDMIKTHLNDNTRKLILKIKDSVCKHEQYGKSFGGWDIYTSVIESKVKSIDDFLKMHSIQNI